jgi:Leucine-rich repeat (LRR) protein
MSIANWNSVMAKCHKLKSVYFNTCQLSDNKYLLNCGANLERLSIYNNKANIGMIFTGANIESLRELSLRCTRIIETVFVEVLPRLKNLTSLCLEKTESSDKFIARVLKNLPNLTTLSLEYLILSDGLKAILDMPNLKVLKLDEIDGINDEFCKTLSYNCTNLTTLSITYDEFFFVFNNCK